MARSQASHRESAPGEQDPQQPRPLSTEMWLFLLVGLFFLLVGLVYGITSSWEPIGTVALLLLVGMYGLAGGYLLLLRRRVDPRPEDNPTSDVDEHAGEIGVYSPHSWWPLVLGAATALAFAGIAIGWWMFGLGLALAIIGLVGQTFEFSRGQHAH